MAIIENMKNVKGTIRQTTSCCPPNGVHDCITNNYGNPATGFLAHEYFKIYYS